MNLRFVILMAAVTVPLAGCSSLKRELGVGRNSPDEFTVVKRAPLSLPPEYELRPPAAQGAAPAASETSARAQETLMGAPRAPLTVGRGEEALLSKAGAQAANPEIRNVIESENGYLALQNETVVEKLVFWKDEDGPNLARIPDSTVDATAEKARLEKNKEEGRAVNDGKVPTIEKKKSTFEKIF